MQFQRVRLPESATDSTNTCNPKLSESGPVFISPPQPSPEGSGSQYLLGAQRTGREVRVHQTAGFHQPSPTPPSQRKRGNGAGTTRGWSADELARRSDGGALGLCGEFKGGRCARRRKPPLFIGVRMLELSEKLSIIITYYHARRAFRVAWCIPHVVFQSEDRVGKLRAPANKERCETMRHTRGRPAVAVVHYAFRWAREPKLRAAVEPWRRPRD